MGGCSGKGGSRREAFQCLEVSLPPNITLARGSQSWHSSVPLKLNRYFMAHFLEANLALELSLRTIKALISCRCTSICKYFHWHRGNPCAL